MENPGSADIQMPFPLMPAIHKKPNVFTAGAFAVGAVGSERTSQRQVRGDVITNNLRVSNERGCPHTSTRPIYATVYYHSFLDLKKEKKKESVPLQNYKN